MVGTSQVQNWPLIAKLRPQLRRHVRTYPQVYRGERWYVLRDESNGHHLRFNALAYEIIGRLDGALTLQEISEQTSTALGEDALSQDEIIQIISQLFATGALRSGIPIDTKEFFSRYQNSQGLRWRRQLMSPLAVRMPMLDPDRILNRLMPWLRSIFSRWGAALWVTVVGIACLLALANAPALTFAVANQDILSPANLLLLWLLFPIVKAVHEFAHALAVKMWGGEVHEMGITLLVLVPVPYVDASAAWAFQDKHKRALVGAAGILAELFLAALALLVWLTVEPGMVRAAALNIMLICTLSTLLFNGNPLLRFDGYYVLQDLVEIPNLYTRASRYYLYLTQHYLFGLDQVRSPVTAVGERSWFAVYGLAAFCYRLFILAAIVLFLAEEYLFAGVALGSWAIATQILLPLFRGVRFLLSSQMLAERRSRAAVVSMLLAGGIAAGLIFLPVPLTTRAEGIVWVPDQAQVYTGTEGFVDKILVPSGAPIEPGVVLIQMRDPTLTARIAVLEARHRGLQIRMTAERLEHRVKSEITSTELAKVDSEMELLREQAESLLVRSAVAGTLVLPEERLLKGRYLSKGELIGYVVSPERLIVRSVVPQSDIGLVRQRVTKVEVRLAERLGETVVAHIVRETPSGTTHLPSRALGASGGGDIAVTSDDEEGLTAAEKVFLLDLGLPEDLEITGLGERAYVRFDHGAEPLARQWLRRGRQLVLSRLAL